MTLLSTQAPIARGPKRVEGAKTRWAANIALHRTGARVARSGR